jgi:hypothetical protein
VDCIPGPYSNPPPTNSEAAANVCSYVPEWCGAEACGNGKIDSYRYLVNNCGFSGASEQCDGAELGGASCQSLGYAGGQLGCTSWCSLDRRKCLTCVGAGASVKSCGPTGLAGVSFPRAMAVAMNGTELGMAWLESNTSDGKREAHFARFGQDLAVLSETAGLGQTVASGGVSRDEYFRISVGSLAQGWVVAIGHGVSSELVMVDAAGKIVGTPRSIPVAGIKVISHPGSGPLLTWNEFLPDADGGSEDAPGPRDAGEDLDADRPDVPRDVSLESLLQPQPQSHWATKVAILAADGLSMTSPVTILRSDGSSDGNTAAFIGDGFLVASQVPSSGIAIARVELDGSASPSGPVVFEGAFEHPQLTAANGDVHLTYNSFADLPGVYWAELDRMGHTVVGPQLLSESRLTRIVGLGADTLVLSGPFREQDTATELELSRLGVDGAARGNPVTVVRDPSGAEFVSAVVLGGDAVVAWLTGGCLGTINLARIAP